MVRNGWVSDPKWRSDDVAVKWFIYGRKTDQAHLWDPFEFKKSISIVNRKSLTYEFENNIRLMVTVWKVQNFETMFAVSFWHQSSSTIATSDGKLFTHEGNFRRLPGKFDFEGRWMFHKCCIIGSHRMLYNRWDPSWDHGVYLDAENVWDVAKLQLKGSYSLLAQKNK